MKKKLYIKPQIRVFQFDTQTAILNYWCPIKIQDFRKK